MPLVHDILRIVKDNGKGKTLVDANASASAGAPKVTKAIVEIHRDEKSISL